MIQPITIIFKLIRKEFLLQDVSIRPLSETDVESDSNVVFSTQRRPPGRPGAAMLANRETNLLRSENSALAQRLKFKERQLKSAKFQIDLLSEQNTVLQARSAELTRSKLMEKVSGRVLKIVDTALFSDLLCRSDPVLLEIAVGMFQKDGLNIEIRKEKRGHMSKSYMCTFEDGEPFVLKKFLFGDKKQADVQNLKFISQECRILRYVGKHANLVQTYGITKLQDGFYSVLSYDGEHSLNEKILNSHFSSDQDIRTLGMGIAVGVNYLQQKGVLHNNLTVENVVLRRAGHVEKPVIIGFTFACREVVSKCLSDEAIKKFLTTYHFPPEVISGRCRLSYSSDVFSVGKIMQKVLRRKLPLTSYQIDKMNLFVEKCCSLNPKDRPIFSDFINGIDIVFTDADL